MGSNPNHYEVLGVAIDSTPGEIRRAYLRLARRHHPDRHATRSVDERRSEEVEMQRINEAWHVLGDAAARREYDAARRGPASARRLRTDRAGHGQWEPFDPTDGPDPRDLVDDSPIPGAQPLPRWLTMVPMVLILASVLSFGAAMVTGVGGFVGVAVTGLVLAGVAFFVVPLIALSRAARDGDL